jgi:hypothetical protein
MKKSSVELVVRSGGISDRARYETSRLDLQSGLYSVACMEGEARSCDGAISTSTKSALLLLVGGDIVDGSVVNGGSKGGERVHCGRDLQVSG